MVDAIKLLLKSRKATVALVTAFATTVVGVITELVPQLKPMQNILMTIFTIIGLVLIYSIAKEDSALKAAQAGAVVDLEQLIKDIIEALLPEEETGEQEPETTNDVAKG